MNESNLIKNEESKVSEEVGTTGTEVKTQTHVSFKECFHDGWREYFRKEDTLLKVLEAASLTSTHEFVQVNSRYLIDNNRIAVILLLKRKDNEILDKVIVDVISGLPTFAQLMDVFYNVGSDCDYSLILYDENNQHVPYGAEDYQGDEIYCNMMASLLSELRGKVSLSVMGIDLEMNEANVVNFKCVNLQSISKDGKDSKLPDRIFFEKAQFWGPYFLPLHSTYVRCDEYNFYCYEYINDRSDYISLVADWDNDGMIADYTFEKDDLIWLLTNKLEEIESMFEGCSINICSKELKVTRKSNISIHDIVNAISKNDGNLISASTEYRLTITRPIPFRNFMYSLDEGRNDLTHEFIRYARAEIYLDEYLGEREDETSQTAAAS